MTEYPCALAKLSAQVEPRVAAMLALRGRGHFGDGDVTEVAQLALHGLIQQPAA